MCAAAIHHRDDIGDTLKHRIEPSFVLKQVFLGRAQEISLAVGSDDCVHLVGGERAERIFGLSQGESHLVHFEMARGRSIRFMGAS